MPPALAACTLAFGCFAFAACGPRQKPLAPEAESPPPETAPGDAPPSLLTFQDTHMGTWFTLRLWADAGQAEAAQSAASDAFARVAKLDAVFSDYRADSEITLLAAQPPGVAAPLSADLFAVLSRAERLSRETDGAFDITVGPMVRLWRQARKNQRLPAPEQIALARERAGWQKLELDRETPAAILRTAHMQLDFGGIAKGYAADEALKILQRRGFPRSLVAASGDIAVGEPPPGEQAWRVGIRSLDVALSSEARDAGDPAAQEAPGLSGTIPLARGAISTSGDTLQAITIGGQRYSHIVDPRTALGLTHRIAVTVTGPDAATTDSYATAVSVMGKERGLAFIESKPGVECFILEAGQGDEIISTRSSGFPLPEKLAPRRP